MKKDNTHKKAPKVPIPPKDQPFKYFKTAGDKVVPLDRKRKLTK